MKAIVIKGDFTEAEFAALVAQIRQLDQARPDARFEITLLDPQRTLMDAQPLIRQVLPELPDRITSFVTVRDHQDT
jgi:hypothetical protein